MGLVSSLELVRRERGMNDPVFLDILFRHVPEGMEFLAVLLTTLGSLAMAAALGSWWAR